MKKNLLVVTILLSLPKEIPLLLFGVLPIRGPCAWVLDVWTLEFEFDKRPSDVCVAIPCESETHKKERLVFDREYAIATQRKKDPNFFFGFCTGVQVSLHAPRLIFAHSWSLPLATRCCAIGTWIENYTQSNPRVLPSSGWRPKILYNY